MQNIERERDKKKEEAKIKSGSAVAILDECARKGTRESGNFSTFTSK